MYLQKSIQIISFLIFRRSSLLTSLPYVQQCSDCLILMHVWRASQDAALALVFSLLLAMAVMSAWLMCWLCSRSACRQGKLDEQALGLFTKGLVTWWITSHASSRAEGTAEDVASSTQDGEASPVPDTAGSSSSSTALHTVEDRLNGMGLKRGSCTERTRSKQVQEAAASLGLAVGGIQEL